MSEQPRKKVTTPDILLKTGIRPPGLSPASAAASIGKTGVFAPRERGVQFVPLSLEPDDSHRQLVLEALEQMFIADAQGIFLDPASDSYRLSLNAGGVASELGVLPLNVGRFIVETIRREAGMPKVDGKVQEGLLRVEHAKHQRRMQVHLIPTAHGTAAALKLIYSLPAASGDLKALGLSPTQQPIVEEVLCKGSGIILVAGTDAEWLTHTCWNFLARGVAGGRRAVMTSSARGADLGEIMRVETTQDPAEQARTIRTVAEAGANCVVVDRMFNREAMQAAADVVSGGTATVLATVQSRNAIDAIAKFCALGLPGSTAAAVALSTFQVQLPLLCPGCARWGEISRDDLGYFAINPAGKTNFMVRMGCQKCNGQVQDFAQIFEVLQTPDTVKAALRTNTAFANVEMDLRDAPGFTPLLQVVTAAANEGRCSLPEARQYLMWQLPPPLPGK